MIGRRTRIKVVKNKMAPPFKEAEFDIMFRGDDVGISKEGSLLDLGVENQIVEKSGTWFSYGGERLGQGRENARLYLRENSDIAMRIESEVRKVLCIPLADSKEAAPEDAAPPVAPSTQTASPESAGSDGAVAKDTNKKTDPGPKAGSKQREKAAA